MEKRSLEDSVIKSPGMGNIKQRKGIGLVLVGGGGRGAYHIGVWKALEEANLKQYVSAVSGTSVGGLNAALFLQGDLEKAQHIWENISPEDILTPKGDSSNGQGRDDFGMHLFSRSGLQKIIRDNLDMRAFDNSEIECYMTCWRIKFGIDEEDYAEMFTCPDGTKKHKKYVSGRTTYFNPRAFSDEDREKILLATSAMPVVFAGEKIGRYYYRDGGLGNNVPVEPLYELEKCKNIIIVHLTANDKNIDYSVKFPNAKICQIRPWRGQRGALGGILDFTAEGARDRIKQGYDDTIERFRNIRKAIDSEIGHQIIREDAYEENKRREKQIEQLSNGICEKLDA